MRLFCDCKTDEEKSTFFLSGRAVETGVIAPAISNEVAMAYHRCAQFKKENDELRTKIEQMEKQEPVGHVMRWMIYTTLTRISARSPCRANWRKLLKHLGKTEADDEPLAYSTILDAVGLDDALWCLRAEPQHASIWRMYAVRCARRVQHLMTDERHIQALDVAERHAHGLATDAELTAARVDAAAAAWGAAGAAAWDAVRAAAWDAVRSAASDTAWAAAWDAVRSAASDTAWDAAWDAARATAEDAIRADFERMLAAHHAMPGEACALVDWWEGKP